MATRASRSALLSVINTISKRHHVSCRSIGNGDVRSRTRVYIRSFGRLCLSLDNLPGRSRGPRTRGTLRVACGTALIDDPVNTPANVVGYIERPIGSDCHARGTMDRTLRSYHRSGETVREDFATSRCACTSEWLEDNVVPTLRVWRPIP